MKLWCQQVVAIYLFCLCLPLTHSLVLVENAISSQTFQSSISLLRNLLCSAIYEGGRDEQTTMKFSSECFAVDDHHRAFVVQ